MISDALRHLTRETTHNAQQWNDAENHTVAAGLLTESGRIIAGLNTYHFLGGPCGEIAALSNHAAQAPADPIVAVAAVYGPTGAVIAPCGKCRQVLFDISPEIRCVVREPNGLTERTVSDLLPLAYDWRHAEQPQRIYMWEGYEAVIRSGQKRQTIRVDDPFQPGAATIVFEKESGEVLSLPATVSTVRTIQRADLTDDDAQLDGFANLQELHAALDTHYPGAPSGDVDLVTFELT